MGGGILNGVFQKFGEAVKSSGKQSTSILGNALSNLTNVYVPDANIAGAAPSPNGGIPLAGTDSLFNPFYVFRYSKFSDSENKYDVRNHRDLKNNASTDWRAIAESPSATKIIEWSRKQSKDSVGPLGGTPYQINDFLWCKHYGKVPNNRLITLRRYPIPIEDNLRVNKSNMPLVPIAQAVTWWGGDTGNKVDDVLGFTYGLNWDMTASAITQDVNGNEIKLDSILDSLAIREKDSPNLHAALKLLFTDSSTDPYAMNGFDDVIQKWVKESYGDQGQYWNRVLGPVNVINTTAIRQQGYTFTHEIKLTFEYSLRSYNNINPKVAMLDLIANFMSLTYNSAEFWGGASRYFQQTGAILPGLPTMSFEKGDYTKGVQEVIGYLMAMTQGKLGDAASALKSVGKGFSGDLSEGTLKDIAAKLEKSNTVKNAVGSRVAELMQKPLSMRSFLDGRAVGEWHVTVGNPMNPIAVIGNLCLKSTLVSFSDDVGIDDFPNSIKFDLVLEPGRPRAKQDIESMFNLGGGNLSWTALPQPSSSRNTYGTYNGIKANLAEIDTAPPLSTAATKDESDASSFNLAAGPTTTSQKSASNLADYFKVNVTNSYGRGFGESAILVDYFTDLKTKD